jgi:hypothetical protein
VLYSKLVARTRPFALLINPPVYDFALYDLYLKPYGLLRVEAWLRGGGWDTACVNALDYEDPLSAALLGRARRKADGTGKFFRTPLSAPQALATQPFATGYERRFARYGLVREAFRARLKEAPGASPPDVILLTSGMTYWYEGLRETARTCRELYPDTPLVAGGLYASLMPEHCARVTGTQAVVKGGASADLAAALHGFGLPSAPGEYPDFPLSASPVWKDAGVLRLNKGCPLKCDYCACRLFFPRFEAGSSRAAFQAFSAFRQAGISNFAFYDDALLVHKEEVFLPFLEEVIARQGESGAGPPRFYLPNAVHIQSLDERTVRLMRRAGFQEIRLGFESSSPDFHREHTPSGAKFRQEDFSACAGMLREAGFPKNSLSAYILAGLPGQRAEEVEESIHRAASLGLRVRLAEFSPVPGSALWEKSVRLCRYPLEEEPLFHNNSFFPLEWEGFTRQDLRRLKTLAATSSTWEL